MTAKLLGGGRAVQCERGLLMPQHGVTIPPTITTIHTPPHTSAHLHTPQTPRPTQSHRPDAPTPHSTDPTHGPPHRASLKPTTSNPEPSTA